MSDQPFPPKRFKMPVLYRPSMDDFGPYRSARNSIRVTIPKGGGTLEALKAKMLPGCNIEPAALDMLAFRRYRPDPGIWELTIGPASSHFRRSGPSGCNEIWADGSERCRLSPLVALLARDKEFGWNNAELVSLCSVSFGCSKPKILVDARAQFSRLPRTKKTSSAGRYTFPALTQDGIGTLSFETTARYDFERNVLVHRMKSPSDDMFVVSARLLKPPKPIDRTPPMPPEELERLHGDGPEPDDSADALVEV